MLSTISKSFRWEMGHRLPFHTEGCQNIHGHSYEMIIELEGEKNNLGMLLDYNDLKAAVKPVLDKWDHAFLVDEKDELLKSFLKENNLKHVLFKNYTTAEHIAHYFCAVLKNILTTHKNLKRIKVTIKETVSSVATAELLMHH